MQITLENFEDRNIKGWKVRPQFSRYFLSFSSHSLCLSLTLFLTFYLSVPGLGRNFYDISCLFHLSLSPTLCLSLSLCLSIYLFPGSGRSFYDISCLFHLSLSLYLTLSLSLWLSLYHVRRVRVQFLRYFVLFSSPCLSLSFSLFFSLFVPRVRAQFSRCFLFHLSLSFFIPHIHSLSLALCLFQSVSVPEKLGIR